MDIDVHLQCSIGGCTNNATREVQFEQTDQWYPYCNECTAAAENDADDVIIERRLPEAKR